MGHEIKNKDLMLRLVGEHEGSDESDERAWLAGMMRIAEMEEKLRRVNQIAWEALGTEIENKTTWNNAMIEIEESTRKDGQ